MSAAMAITTSEVQPRCIFLEAPREIRDIIYEEIAELHRDDRYCLQVGFEQLATGETSTPWAGAITQVSRQMQDESSPIVYRHMDIEVEICMWTKRGRRQATRWAKAIDPAVLPKIFNLTFFGLEGVKCTLTTDWGWVDKVVTVRHSCRDFYVRPKACSDVCYAWCSIERDLDAKMYGLEKRERRWNWDTLVMTKEALESLVEMFRSATIKAGQPIGLASMGWNWDDSY